MRGGGGRGVFEERKEGILGNRDKGEDVCIVGGEERENVLRARERGGGGLERGDDYLGRA